MPEYAKPAPLARDAMAYVLAGGRGSRLMEMTDNLILVALGARLKLMLAGWRTVHLGICSISRQSTYSSASGWGLADSTGEDMVDV